MSRKLRLGWVGSGFIGQVAHLINYSEIPEVEIVGLAELRPKLGEVACRKFGIPKYYDCHKSLLEDQNVDAVVAIVRREHTASVALDILQKGIPLFTEKPMAPTVKQGEWLVNAANENDCLYVTGFMRRHDEGVQIAKNILLDLLEGGDFGEPLFFRCYCFGGGDYCNISGYSKTDEPTPRHQVWPIAPDWVPSELEREYESFLNVFIHDVNLIRYLAGSTPLVRHVDYRRNSGSITLDFEAFPGVFEFAHLQTNRYWEEGIEILFSKGRLELVLPPAFLRNQPATLRLYKETLTGATEMRSPRPDWTWAFRRQADAFVRNLLDGTASIAGGTDSLEDLHFVENIWKKIV